MDEELKNVTEPEEAAETAQPEETAPEPMEPIEAEAEAEEESIGNIKISVDVVSTIAGIAASEIEGVSCMYTSFVDGVAQISRWFAGSRLPWAFLRIGLRARWNRDF